MKADVEVRSVSVVRTSSALATGEALGVVLEGEARGAGELAPAVRVEITMPDSERNRRAFYVGRRVVLALEPR